MAYNIEYELKILKIILCQIQSKLLQLQVNGTNNDSQTLLNFTDSDSIKFTDLTKGKVTAYSKILDKYETHADAVAGLITSTVDRFIIVNTDETNNNEITMWFNYRGTLRFIQTLTPQ